ncbi:creatininase/formamide hydrolase [Lucifera butyrica]|uniref:Creatininase/formamide hydrolase n=1 Tax=Lucifera butyrica TaxID=1351585 RepID=A0A498RGH7_9FIRM|nr:3-dehydro-scyllo-inosose hydrolase [Lucifera butyrica]VBB08218.1 creatininase/formamide hydrolase [Lucifera butyrica]
MAKWQIPAKGGNMEADNGIYYQNMTNREVEERLKKNDVILIPVGSTENHGPNSPYGEDTYLDTRLCEQVAKATGCTVAQPIWYGSHPYHHLGMPGTIMIPEETLADYLCYVFAGFWNTGFRKMIVVNGHGQDYVIPLAIHKFGKKFQVPGIVLYVHFWNCAKEQLDVKENGGPYNTPFIHADEVEQSWSLALFPEFCKQEYAVKTKPSPMLPPGHINNSAERGVGPIKWYNAYGSVGMECICTPEGVIGDPTQADAEKAREGVERTLNYLEKLVNDILEKYPAGKLPPIEKVTQRKREDIEAVIKGPTKGGRHIYTLTY